MYMSFRRVAAAVMTCSAAALVSGCTLPGSVAPSNSSSSTSQPDASTTSGSDGFEPLSKSLPDARVVLEQRISGSATIELPADVKAEKYIVAVSCNAGDKVIKYEIFALNGSLAAGDGFVTGAEMCRKDGSANYTTPALDAKNMTTRFDIKLSEPVDAYFSVLATNPSQ